METDLWIIDLSDAAKYAPAILRKKILSEQERNNALIILNPIQRDEYICSLAVIRSILQEACGMEIFAKSFATSPNGKPFVPHSKIRFSYARTRELAVLGLSSSGNIGVDTEFCAASSSNRGNAIAKDKEIHHIITFLVNYLKEKHGFEFPHPVNAVSAWTILESLIKLHDKTLYWVAGTHGMAWIEKAISNPYCSIRIYPDKSKGYVVAVATQNDVANISQVINRRFSSIAPLINL